MKLEQWAGDNCKGESQHVGLTVTYLASRVSSFLPALRMWTCCSLEVIWIYSVMKVLGLGITQRNTSLENHEPWPTVFLSLAVHGE